MIPLFLGITAVNLICLGVVTGFGYAVSNGHDFRTAHQLGGALATIVCCGVHCIVFTYFMATSKWVRHAILVKKLDPALWTATRSFKRQAFPAAMFAMATVCITAFVGAATLGYAIRPIYHHGLAIACLVVNVGVAVVEYRAIVRNGALIDSVLAVIRQQDATRGTLSGGQASKSAPVAEWQTLRT